MDSDHLPLRMRFIENKKEGEDDDLEAETVNESINEIKCWEKEAIKKYKESIEIWYQKKGGNTRGERYKEKVGEDKGFHATMVKKKRVRKRKELEYQRMMGQKLHEEEEGGKENFLEMEDRKSEGTVH